MKRCENQYWVWQLEIRRLSDSSVVRTNKPEYSVFRMNGGDSSVGPVAKTLPSNQGMWVQSLVGEQRSNLPCGQKNNTCNKQYHNKFIKDF